MTNEMMRPSAFTKHIYALSPALIRFSRARRIVLFRIGSEAPVFQRAMQYQTIPFRASAKTTESVAPTRSRDDLTAVNEDRISAKNVYSDFLKANLPAP
jgi:hypothetical protein